jgi:hypothetical protein
MKPETALLWLLLGAAPLFSLGTREEEEQIEPQDTQWTLAITSFDTSALGESNSGMAETIMLELAKNIGRVNYRLRVAEEYAYYRTLAERQNLSATAGTLMNKRNERDQLLYRGEPEWKYRRDLKALDAEIKKLEEDYRQVQERWSGPVSAALIEWEPVFSLAKENMDGVFPPAPREGDEYRFCKNQKIDAFISGTMSTYYGRIFVTQNLYILYAGSYVYRDSIIFSPERTAEAMADFADRITGTIAGIPPAELLVSTRPENALVLLDRGYAGQGQLEQTYPPGKVSLEVFAEDHEILDVELDLQGGERAELTVDLKSVDQTPLNITLPGGEGGSVYLDSLYMGETPLTLNLPRNRLQYLFVETPEGEAEAVFLSPDPQALPPAIRSPLRPGPFAGLFSSKKSNLRGDTLNLRTTPAYDPEEGRVDRVRRQYYWAWGGTWITAIGAWMMNGYANSVVNAYNSAPVQTQDMYDKARQAQTLNWVGIGVVSAAVIVEIIQMARYMSTAGKDAPQYVE